MKAKGVLNNDLFEEYKNLGNAVVRLIRKEKANYYTSLLQNCDNGWNALSQVIYTKNSKNKIS